MLPAFLKSRRVETPTVDAETSTHYSVIYTALRRARTPIPSDDLRIAATAMQRGLILLTFDAHFLTIPQVIVERID